MQGWLVNGLFSQQMNEWSNKQTVEWMRESTMMLAVSAMEAGHTYKASQCVARGRAGSMTEEDKQGPWPYLDARQHALP